MKLFEQQETAIDHLKKWKVGALFMEAGTGKTRVAVELVNSVNDADLIVWVGPLRTIKTGVDSVDSVKDEIARWGGFSAPAAYYGVESLSASDRIFMELYELMETHHNVFMVVDESIKIKNASAKRTKRILRLSEMAKYKLILNGTPLSKNLLDLWPQMEFLSPKILNMSQAKYKDTFCNYMVITKRYGNWEKKREFITGYENVDYLHSLIKNYVYQCDLRLNVKQNYYDLKYRLDDDARDEYEQIKEDFLSDEKLEFLNDNIFMAMTQKMQHSYCMTEDKFAELDNLFEEINESETLIFCKYIDSQEECRKRYPKALVLSYQKNSLGLNLQAYNHTVYFDKVWDYALRSQSTRRTFRVGQEQDCIYYDLTGNVGLERMIDKCMDKKINLSEYFKTISRKELKKEL